jgi:NDP-hexose 2,3-enoyl reductase
MTRTTPPRSPDIALAWLLHQPRVTGPTIGPPTLDQLDRSLQALDLHLGASELARLDEIFPGLEAHAG